MTKDVMRLKFLQSKLSIQEFDEFFSQNVVIPKGENRHPDADLFHKVIENPHINIETDRWAMTWKEDECLFYKNGITNDKSIIRYRIKPQEPIYEWQWYYIDCGVAFLSDSFLTIDEAMDKWDYKIEETKRVRK